MSRKRFTFWLDDTKNEQNELINQVDDLKQKRTFAKTIRDGIRLVMSLSSGSMDVLFELFPFVQAEFLQYVESLQINAEQGEKKTLSAQNDQLQKRVIELETENATLRERNIGLQAVIEESEDYIAELESEQDRQPSEETSAIQKQLARLEELLLQQGNIPIETSQQTIPSTKPSGGVGLKGNSPDGIGLKATGLKGGELGSTIAAPPPTFDDDDDLPDLTFTQAKPSTNANQNLINSLLGLQS